MRAGEVQSRSHLELPQPGCRQAVPGAVFEVWRAGSLQGTRHKPHFPRLCTNVRPRLHSSLGDSYIENLFPRMAVSFQHIILFFFQFTSGFICWSFFILQQPPTTELDQIKCTANSTFKFQTSVREAWLETSPEGREVNFSFPPGIIPAAKKKAVLFQVGV